MTLSEQVKATYAVVGQEINDFGLEIILRELKQHRLNDVEFALRRCRLELKKITLADILERFPTGPSKRQGVEEAWSFVAQKLGDERRSFVWTDEMAEAFGAAYPLRDDLVAARMAFKEVYQAAVARARAENRPPCWTASLGWDAAGREEAQLEAARLNQLAFTPMPQLDGKP